jgi:hypothetical protein
MKANAFRADFHPHTKERTMRESLSSNHLSNEEQVEAVLDFIRLNVPKHWDLLVNQDWDFLTLDGEIDVKQMGDEQVPWLQDTIEELEPFALTEDHHLWSICWDEGEPWLERDMTPTEICRGVLESTTNAFGPFMDKNQYLETQEKLGERAEEIMRSALLGFLPSEDWGNSGGLEDAEVLVAAGVLIGIMEATKAIGNILAG